MTRTSAVREDTRNEKRGVLRSLAKNTSFLTLGQLGAKLFSVVFVALLARAIGPEGVGRYALGGAIVAVFLILPGFGFDMLLVREIAKSRDKTGDFVGNTFALKLCSIAISGALLVGFAKLRHFDTQMVQLTLLLLVSGIAQAFVSTFNAVFQANEKMKFQAAIMLASNILRVGLGILAIKLRFGLNSIVLVLLVGDLASIVAGAVLVSRFVVLRLRFDLEVFKKIMLAVVPFGILSLINVVWMNTNNLLIGRMVGEKAVGWYSAANRILEFALLIPNMFANAVFPILSRLHGTERETLAVTYSKSFSYLMSLAFPVAIGGFLVCDRLIHLIYGARFANTIPIFQVMVWVTMFTFVGYLNGTTLNAIGRERLFATTYSFLTLANIGLDYIFIRRFGYIGACYATLVLTCIGFITYTIVCHRALRVAVDWHTILRSLVAAAVMGALVQIAIMLAVHVVAVLFLGAVVYMGLIVVLGVVPREIIRKFLGSAGSRPPGDSR